MLCNDSAFSDKGSLKIAKVCAISKIPVQREISKGGRLIIMNNKCW
jgi:hypothetical protein